MTGTYLEFNLDGEIRQLLEERAWSTGRNSKTLAKYDDFRVVLTALRAGAHIPEHRTEGRISIQTVRGHIQVRAEGRTFAMRAGALLTLDRDVPHDVEAQEDSAFLLTIAWPQR
jgi:quercetin dioxygenase-like cupin family protein